MHRPDPSAAADAARGRDDIAVGLIVADDGRVLLQHRDDTPGIAAPNLWALFGGHLEPHERPSAAFLRELREELGWQPRHFEHYATREAPPLPGIASADGKPLISHLYAAHLDVALAALTLGEGQAMALFRPDALPAGSVPGLDLLIGEFARSDAYKRVKRAWDLISTTGLIVDARGRFLLQVRDDKPGIVNPGVWGSFGGRVEPHETDRRETPEEGFLREMREELSWEPRRVELFAGAPYRSLGEGDQRHQLIYVFAAALNVPEDALILGEGQAMGLFAPDALPEPIVPALRALIERFMQAPTYRDMVHAADG